MVFLLVMPASANSVLTATLTGAAEAPNPGDPDATGEATVTALDNGSICWSITFAGLDSDLPNLGHIHEEEVGVAGPVVLDFGLADDTPSPITGCSDPDVTRDLAQELQDAPEDYYVNLHNTEFPGGAIRGQLAEDEVLLPVEASAYINADVGLETANENVPDDSSCETPTQADTQTVSSEGGVENNVHVDACLFDVNGDYIDASVSFESSGVGTISACPDPDAEGPKTSTSDGTTCTQSGFQLMGAPGRFEYHARFNSEEAGTQTVLFCYDPEENGCGANDTILDTITITWVAADPAPVETGMLMIMKHYCNADDSNPETTVDVRSEEEFEEVEAAGGGDPIVAVALTVLACPVERLIGDEPVSDTIAHFEEEFDFLVTDSTGAPFTLADADFINLHACEADDGRSPLVLGEVDGDPDTNVCVDFSFYAIDGVAEGEVTVVETFHEGDHEFGTLRFTPTEVDGNNDAETLIDVDRQTSTVIIDTSLDDDDMVMLHIYNFDTAGDAAPATPATPAASVLPDAAVNPTGTFGSSIIAILFGIMALASIGFLGFRTVAVRRNR